MIWQKQIKQKIKIKIELTISNLIKQHYRHRLKNYCEIHDNNPGACYLGQRHNKNYQAGSTTLPEPQTLPEIRQTRFFVFLSLF
ncbi:MAG: hypothetical protein WA093_02185 [Minisyncoccales bacterium]